MAPHRTPAIFFHFSLAGSRSTSPAAEFAAILVNLPPPDSFNPFAPYNSIQVVDFAHALLRFDESATSYEGLTKAHYDRELWKTKAQPPELVISDFLTLLDLWKTNFTHRPIELMCWNQIVQASRLKQLVQAAKRASADVFTRPIADVKQLSHLLNFSSSMWPDSGDYNQSLRAANNFDTVFAQYAGAMVVKNESNLSEPCPFDVLSAFNNGSTPWPEAHLPHTLPALSTVVKMAYLTTWLVGNHIDSSSFFAFQPTTSPASTARK